MRGRASLEGDDSVGVAGRVFLPHANSDVSAPNLRASLKPPPKLKRSPAVRSMRRSDSNELKTSAKELGNFCKLTKANQTVKLLEIQLQEQIFACYAITIKEITMRKIFAATFLAYASLWSFTWAASVEGTILSVDSELRTLTMETGEIWNLSEFVVLDGIEPGQIVRITYEDTTVDATAVDILEKPAELSVADETLGGASVE